MPLYALLDYTRTRGDLASVDRYGIALLKRELFVAGARPVIYGLSRQHQESNIKCWPRMLHDSCGISEDEQYRYVAMNLKNERPIDWSHEREWRWADCEDKFGCPGLPVWLKNKFISFSKIIVIVPTSNEAERVLDKLKLMRDAKTDGYDNPYQQEPIIETRVLSLEEAVARSHSQPGKPLRIDDIPVRQLKEVVAPMPSQELLARVETAVKIAREAAEEGAKQWRESHGRGDVFGFAYLMVDGSRTEVVEALLQLNEINEIACSDGLGYRMANIGGSYETHLLGEAEAGVMAAKTYLERELPGTAFRMRTVWD
jgi:hypothetical protein